MTLPTVASGALAGAGAAGGASGIGDQRLRDAVERALSVQSQVDGTAAAASMVGIEALGSATADIADAIRAVGGVVTGSVDGQVVQAAVPAASVADLTAVRSIRYLQAPRRVSRPPQPGIGRLAATEGFGPTVGLNAGLTGAATWQGAGVDGSVKVGIIDYFDLGLWDVAEEGPRPDTLAPAAVDPHGHSVGRTFCLDTSGVLPNYCPLATDGLNDHNGEEHGVAVSQVVKDMAPAAELYLATVATVSDLQAAIDWFALNGVPIVTRSLGAAYDGPGDGTGPLDSVVDHAAALGITWFNSGGNEAVDGYFRTVVPGNLSATGGYIDFDSGPGVDTYLRISGNCIGLDGVRWSDWNLPPSQRTDYSLEFYEPTTNPDVASDENFNPTNLTLIGRIDDRQSLGALPLEGADSSLCPVNSFGFADGITYLRVRRGGPVIGAADILEVATSFGVMELGRSQAAYSGAKPVVDSANPALVAVGAIDPADGNASVNTGREPIASYSSQGPTNDGRVKPDVSAPSCVASTVYAPDCFNGTSAASPTAAGVAALLLDAGIALPGAHLAAAVKHFVIDRRWNDGNTFFPDGPDNKYGTGEIRLPAPQFNQPRSAPSAFVAMVPQRVLDTRPLATHRTYDIVDLDLSPWVTNATAVALNITSTDSATPGFVQVVPYLASPLGASSTLNVAVPGGAKPNFAVVPVSSSGIISIYLPPGGAVLVDLLGSFQEVGGPIPFGRFVPITPERQLDTRSSTLVPAGWVAHKPTNEAVRLQLPVSSAVPAAGVSALVLNVTSTQATGVGFLRAQPTGMVTTTSTVNYVANTDSANTVIVPLGADGTVSIFTSGSSHVIADVTGYITNVGAPASTSGLFVPVALSRVYDSRNPGQAPLAAGTSRTASLAASAAVLAPGLFGASVPSAVSVNVTAVDEQNFGFITGYPSGTGLPPTSTLNYQPGAAVANGALLKLSPGGGLDVFSSAQSNFILDVNGFFTG